MKTVLKAELLLSSIVVGLAIGLLLLGKAPEKTDTQIALGEAGISINMGR